MARFKQLVDMANQKSLAGNWPPDKITHYISMSLYKAANHLTDTKKMRQSVKGGSLWYTVLSPSNTCSAVTPVGMVGVFQPTIYVSFQSKKVVNETSIVVASKESMLRALN